jgi:hypothetical protein
MTWMVLRVPSFNLLVGKDYQVVLIPFQRPPFERGVSASRVSCRIETSRAGNEFGNGKCTRSIPLKSSDGSSRARSLLV